MQLKEKVAIITGGGRGIGRALALGFAAEGAKLVIAARTEAQLNAVAEEIRARNGEVIVVVCDVSDEAQVKAMVKQTVDSFGGVDILINNAGVGGFRPAYATNASSWDKMMNVNAKSTFLCTKHVWRSMRKRGGGSIINIASLAGTRAYPMYAAYSASKWGQIGFTKATAEEGKPVNIRINAIAPGKVDNEMRAAIAEDKDKMLKNEDLVGAALFFAGDAARYVTGQVLEVEWFGKE
jgi:NAD(P)-dependent dehydrogenase (short-subunit alcohol dehydrogenase family)